jgi:colicin import membrane protein
MKLNSKGFIGTATVHLFVIFLLIFFGFSVPDTPPTEEGILVNFGTDKTGLGDVEPAGSEVQGSSKENTPVISEPEPVIREKAVKVKVKAKVTVQKKAAEKIVQNYEESPVKVKTPTPEELKQQETVRQQQELEKTQKAEEARKQQVAQQWSNKGQAAFGKKGVGTGQGSEGITQGTGNQGNPNGSPGAKNYGDGGGLGNGISFGLGNRTGEIPKPVDKCTVTSKVVVKVQIVVDRDGNVVGVPKVIESNFQDACIDEAVIKAASKAKFNTDANAAYRQQGWIRFTYEP